MRVFRNHLAVWVTLTLSCLAVTAGADMNALLGRIPDRDGDGKHTGPSPADAKALIDGVVGGGPAVMDELIGMLVESGELEDYKARYALHAVAVHVTAPGRETARKQLVAALLKALNAVPGPDVCLFLIDELQFLHPQDAIGTLAKCLSDEKLCDPAARALVAIGGNAAKALQDALPKSKGGGTLSVIQALGAIRVADAVPALAARLNDTSPDVAVAAAVALARIGSAGAAAPMMKRLAKLEGRSRDELTDACFVLAANLIAGGKRDDAFDIYRGIWSAMGDSSAPHVRTAIVVGLAMGLSSDSTDSLTGKLKSDDPATRAAVLHVLGARDDAAVFDAVAGAMKDRDAGVRLVAARTLPRIGGGKCVPPLVAALPGDDAESAHVLRSALIALSGDDVNDALAVALESAKDVNVRLAILAVLVPRKATVAGDAVFPLIADGEGSVRTMALKTLGEIGSGNLAAQLADHIRSGKAESELKAAEDALAGICSRGSKGKEQVKLLSDAMQGADEKAACVLVRVIGRLGSKEAAAYLVEAVGKAKGAVLDEVVRGLADFPNSKPGPELLKLAREAGNEKHQVLALRGYVRMAEKERNEKQRFAMLREAMNAARRPDEKRLALGIISKHRNVAALEQVAAYIGDVEVNNEAALAAIRIGDRIRLNHRQEVSAVMKQIVAATKDNGVRKKAEGLLKKMGEKLD